MTTKCKNRLIMAAIVAVVLMVVACLFCLHRTAGLSGWGSPTDTTKGMTCEPIPQPEMPVLQSMMDLDFVDKELAEYEILGKWHVVQETGYVICRKGGELWSTYYEKDTREVGVLIPLKQRVEDGDTILYSEQSFGGEYMIIRRDGLYIYGAEGCDPYVWPNER